MRKFILISILLVVVVVLSIIVVLVPDEESNLMVMDAKGYVTIENDYYIANISKTHAGIEHFYIKPYHTVNIVARTKILGLHEIQCSTGDSIYDSVQTSPSRIKHYDTTVMTNDGSTVVVRSRFRMHDASGSVFEVNMTEWKVFYANRPWFVVTFIQEFITEAQFWNENQCCFVYDKDYPSEYSMLDDNGTTIVDDYERGHHYSSKHLEKYMWVHVANSTYETGIGQILIDASPGSLTARLGEWFGTNYREWQLTLNEHSMGLSANSKQQATYINYVAYDKNTIDTFAEELYKTNHKVEATTEFVPHLMNNCSHPELGGIGKSGSVFWNFPRINARMRLFTEGDNGEDFRNVYMEFINSSGTYNVVNGWTFPSNYWNTTYANLTARTEFESKITCDVLTEVWRDNDAIKTKVTFGTLATMNITDLRIHFHNYPPYRWVSMTSLSTDIFLLNASDTKVHWMFDYGTAFKNLTAYAKRTDDGISRFYYYLLDNISDVEYNSGESWSLTLKIHKFIRTKEQGTLFQASDFLETGSDLRNFNYHIWVPLHFPDTSSGDVNFYLKYAGEQHYHLVESSFDGTELDITFVGETDQTVTHELYIDQLGTPKSVENVDSWSYNATTKILAFIVTYTSAKTVTVSWDEAGGQVAVYTLSVWGRKNGLSKNAIVNLNGENCSIISMTMYMLPYRSYLMTVRAEGDDNKRWIIVYKIT